jgi:CRISPR type III-A-associated RAMP protein Csm4
MPVALLAKLKPAGPWRMGSDSGAADRVERILHSDTWYSAICQAMAQLGWLESWLAATAQAGLPAVRISSLFFGLDDALLTPAPANLWPPANASGKLRLEVASYIPASLVGQLAAGVPFNEDQWEVDGYSGCLLRRGRKSARSGPYRVSLRSYAAVDRLEPGRVSPHQMACIEWAENAYLWFVAEFASAEAQAEWSPRVESALRLLGDSGVGGKRSAGWGHFTLESVEHGELPQLVLGEPRPVADAEAGAPATSETAFWLLSLLCPGEADSIDWSRGSFSILDRSGRVESQAGWGVEKRQLRMVREGSVLVTPQAPTGSAPDVAPDGFAHPVYCNGFAVSIPLPWRVNV